MYVSNLGYQTTEDDLRSLFESYGPVNSAKVITDRETGRSRGFGFVEMPSDEEAGNAMRGLDGKEFGGRALSVSVAREKENRNGKKGW